MTLIDEHLETELPTRPMDETTTQTYFMILMAAKEGGLDDTQEWRFDPDAESEPPVPFNCKVLRKRIDVLGLKLEFTEAAGILIAVLTKGSPGETMYVLHKACNHFEARGAERWLLTTEVMSTELFPMGYVTPEAFAAWWDGQKDERGGNKVDYCIPSTWIR